MNTKLCNLLIFTAGAAIGSAVTWKLVTTKYEQIIQEEIDSIKEAYSKDEDEFMDEELEEIISEFDTPHGSYAEKPSLQEYAKMVSGEGYTNEEEEEETMIDEPYVISPDEFGELDYPMISLNYYEDGVITDDNDHIIDDPKDIIGINPLDHFGEYEEDSVHVRNDALKCDYEILRDTRKYYDVYPEEE